MGYEALGEVKFVKLGGVDAKTGKKNPTEIEGYYHSSEERPNKFNKDKPQKFYVFKTARGLEGIFGSGGLDKLMSGAALGTMTKVVDTGDRKDVGKGQPMKIYKVFQDSGNLNTSSEVTTNYVETDYSDDSDLVDEEPTEETRPTRATAPSQPAVAATASNQKRVQDILNRSKRA